MKKLKMESKDILNENIERVVELFPNVLVESEDGKKIDFDILRQELSDDIVDGPRERYHLDFPGKREAIIEANRKTTKTLRPIKEKSVNFDTTKNIYIEGDNLETLKILQESYLGKIKCIYIDPPYNTGSDFVYNDDFSHSEKEELEKSGRIDENGNVITSKDINNESKGRYHSDWLKMMYPRLKLARNLLSDDGVIFISIDDNEVDNLRKLCDEVFGENNFVAIFSWMKTATPPSLSINIRKKLEMLLLYKKSEKGNGLDGSIVDGGDMPLLNETNAIRELIIKKEAIVCKIPDGVYKPGQYDRVIILDEFKVKNGKAMTDLCLKGPFKWTQETLNIETANLTTYYVKSEKFAVRYCRKGERIKLPSNFIAKGECAVGTNEDGAKEIKRLFNEMKVFDFPKPISLIKYIVNMKAKDNDTILDFFSGSATTAHAVMKLNAEDGGNRQFIMVQLPEATDEGSEAYKAGFKNICDIGEERIRRAGKKILEELSSHSSPVQVEAKLRESEKNVGASTASPLDIGFRVYKIDDSNMKDIYYKPSELSQENVLGLISNVKEDRSAHDLLIQVTLNLGLTLDLKIEEKRIGDNLYYFVEDNALVACFDNKINLDTLKEALVDKPLKIVCKESSFEKDQDKINFNERIKKYSPETEKYII